MTADCIVHHDSHAPATLAQSHRQAHTTANWEQT